ncbi:hypothetical protein [Flavobacterium sp.]|uniref:hypothetical protein n=1 Tax=Flavobacterium sp. TaxID=239 RepID=UPI00120DCD87|nr:hypothetical protein [Flavobacterium sp.]RZJ71937.1 MAG: hypothetical protein EOO49_07865 [Flavobacterium sp.]
MKSLVITAFFICGCAFSQTTVFLKGGEKLVASDFLVKPASKKVEFRANGRDHLVKFADFDSATTDKKVLKKFAIGKKARLFYVLAQSKNRTLGVSSTKRVQERGGFSGVVTRYEVAVIEDGKILKELSFTESKTKSEIEKRGQFFEIVNQYFQDCTDFKNKVDLFRSSQDDTNSIVLNILDNPEKTSCK